MRPWQGGMMRQIDPGSFQYFWAESWAKYHHYKIISATVETMNARKSLHDLMKKAP